MSKSLLVSDCINDKVFNDSHHYTDYRNEDSNPLEVLLHNKEPLKVFFTEDRDLVNQYYLLRQDCFEKVDNRYKDLHSSDCEEWHDYDGSESRDDRMGKIIVAVNDNNEVVGGLRLLLSEWIDKTMNEDENSGYTIKKFLKDNGLDYKAKYSEIGGLVIKSSYRSTGLLNKISEMAIDESLRNGCQYVITISIKSSARKYKMVANSLGYECKIFTNYPWIMKKNHGYECRYPTVGTFNRF